MVDLRQALMRNKSSKISALLSDRERARQVAEVLWRALQRMNQETAPWSLEAVFRPNGSFGIHGFSSTSRWWQLAVMAHLVNHQKARVHKDGENFKFEIVDRES